MARFWHHNDFQHDFRTGWWHALAPLTLIRWTSRKTGCFTAIGGKRADRKNFVTTVAGNCTNSRKNPSHPVNLPLLNSTRTNEAGKAVRLIPARASSCFQKRGKDPFCFFFTNFFSSFIFIQYFLPILSVMCHIFSVLIFPLMFLFISITCANLLVCKLYRDKLQIRSMIDVQNTAVLLLKGKYTVSVENLQIFRQVCRIEMKF